MQSKMHAKIDFIPPKMRLADPDQPDRHLLEELAKPAACVSAGRISVWVYRDCRAIREIVLTGHSESRTCSAATSVLIEAAKDLGDGVRWMLTCGAAHFEVSETELDALDPVRMMVTLSAQDFSSSKDIHGLLETMEALRLESQQNQRILQEIENELTRLAEETGLVQVFVLPWSSVDAFRRDFEARRRASSPLIVLPERPGNGRVATFLPLIPNSDPEEHPFIIRLEGWDYDCPNFQRVADIHLRKMCRELLRDALRRRRTYRRWLQEWIERWIEQLSWLPEQEAEAVCLQIPPPSDSPLSDAQFVGVRDFLQNNLSSFVDKSHQWPERQKVLYKNRGYNRTPPAELDDEYRPEKITIVDFERGTSTTRPTTTDDPPTTLRKQITDDMPLLISRCLKFIGDMDANITPYETLRTRYGAERTLEGVAVNRSNNAKLRPINDALSRSIVLETMIRGWPSFYLEDEQDQAVFREWAQEYRPQVWAVINEQAAKAGIAVEQLLEDNVIYDVRFDEDLGCTVQPLVLADDAAHAQLHGSGAGASVVVPLWTRWNHNPMPKQVLALAPTNSGRAEKLVGEAADRTTGTSPDIVGAQHLLRMALACHPARAGRLILEEWARRLGRNTRTEFLQARRMIEAAELCSRFRYAEASQRVIDYLAEEPQPIRDAIVIAAICEIGQDDCKHFTELRQTKVRSDALRQQYKELMPKIEAIIKQKGIHPQSLTLEEQRILKNWDWIDEELPRLDKKLDSLALQVKASSERRKSLINSALTDTSSLSEYPMLIQAARDAELELRTALTEDGSYRGNCITQDYLYRYHFPLRGLVNLLGLLDIIYGLARIIHRLEENPIEARVESVTEIRQLADDLWLPEILEDEFRQVAEEFGKGEWDRLQSQQILDFLHNANKTCQEYMEGLINGEDSAVLHVPYAEGIYTRIHLLQIFLADYWIAFQSLLGATIPLKHAVRGSWEVLAVQDVQYPEGGSFYFDRITCTIGLRAPSASTSLLRAHGLSDGELDYLVEVFADPNFLTRLSFRNVQSLTEAILGANIEPPPEWRFWRDTIKGIPRELIAAMSLWSFEANLMPDYSPRLSAKGQEWVRRLDMLDPRLDPEFDWGWTKLGDWQAFIGSDALRIKGAVYFESRNT